MKMKELIGQKVNHVTNGDGIITEVSDDGVITVSHSQFTKNYVYESILNNKLQLLDKDFSYKFMLNVCQEKSSNINKTLESCLAELDSMVGLGSIKEQIRDLICEYKISMLRERCGLKAIKSTKHMVFIGNPGTGKTTVARIIARIYKALGILSVGHLVEADRASLVAGYEGQTALKTKKVIDSALGGILFIDEAYSLNRGHNDTYGLECIDALNKAIEDHRDDLVVIVAGYKNEMNEFLKSNTGLSSRFKNFIEFNDYSHEELFSIYKGFLKSNDYNLSPLAEEKAKRYFKSTPFLSGNGRTVRNIFENTIRLQSRRLNNEPNLTFKTLSSIEESDLNFDLIH